MSSVKELLNRKPTLRAASLLSLPLLWLGVIYIGSLFALFITSIWKIDTFTSKIIREFTLENFIDVFTDRAYFNVTIRTLFVAICVTVICAAIAIPMAFFIARIAREKISPSINCSTYHPTLGLLPSENICLAHDVLSREWIY